MESSEIEKKEKRILLWNFAFLGLREISVGVFFLLVCPFFWMAWKNDLFQRPLLILIPFLGFGILLALLTRGRGLTFQGYYARRTGYAEPKYFPRSKWNNRKVMAAALISSPFAGIALFLLLAFFIRYREDAVLVAFFTGITTLMAVTFLAEGIWEMHKPYILAALVMMAGAAVCLCLPKLDSFRAFSPLLPLGFGFLVAGILDHRIYLRMWKEGARIGDAFGDGKQGA